MRPRPFSRGWVEIESDVPVPQTSFNEAAAFQPRMEACAYVGGPYSRWLQ